MYEEPNLFMFPRPELTLYEQRKRLVCEAYGGLQCNRCGLAVLHYLVLDHAEGQKAHTPVRQLDGPRLFHYLMVKGYPERDKIQVLCGNCKTKRIREENANKSHSS